MTITELLPQVASLAHEDKFRLMQFLLASLANEEGIEMDLQAASSTHKQPNKSLRLEDLRGYLKHQGEPLTDEQLCAPINERDFT